MRAVTFDEGTGELGSRRGTFAEEFKSNHLIRATEGERLSVLTQRFSHSQCFLKILHNLQHLSITQMFFLATDLWRSCGQ